MRTCNLSGSISWKKGRGVCTPADASFTEGHGRYLENVSILIEIFMNRQAIYS
jgi:hypothetical protein